MSSYGKLSLKGSENFEKKMSKLLDDIADDIRLYVNESFYETVILIGGYGRGEGGVVKVNGVEEAHNNLDFIIISKNIDSSTEDVLYKQFEDIFNHHTKNLSLEVEFTILDTKKFKNCPPLVITYDMKYGHKLIAGRNNILVNNKNFELNKIPSWDVRNLMVNRGTLLIINDLMLNKNERTLKEKKIVIKHWIKAIIGYGDALLYHLGEYHYSYEEKQKRMKKQKNVDQDFKDLYNEAMNFRFEPNYEQYLELDLNIYQQYVKSELLKIHIRCEQLSLKSNDISWMNFINKALKHAVTDNLFTKSFIKKLYYLTKNVPFLKKLTFFENILFRMLGMQGMMPIVFPYVAFDIKSLEFDAILSDFFKSDKENTCYKNLYLSYWKKYINTNYVQEDFGL